MNSGAGESATLETTRDPGNADGPGLESVGNSMLQPRPSQEQRFLPFDSNELITIQVDQTLFRMSADIFSICASPRNWEIPLAITGLSSDQWSYFLSVVEATTIDGPPSFPPETWISALHVATQLGCDIIRSYVIERIAGSRPLFDPVTLATIGLKYQIDEWAQENFEMLITRSVAPSLEDGMALGMERILAICRCREVYKSTNRDHSQVLQSLIAREPSLKNPLPERLDEVGFHLSTGDGNPVKHPQHYVSRLHNVTIDGVVWKAPFNLTGQATVLELESYLQVVNARHFVEPDGSGMGLIFSQWAGVLRLATILGNSAARDFVIRFVEIHFQDEDPFDIIDAAKSCKVHSWLQPQYLRIATRSAFPTEEEAERLGTQSLLVVCRLREERKAAPATS
ncbi:hypothetical protein FRC01_002036 [Tulasnella sp. 417]|nr:hypothetical protein FRC01_002036 [Tulasnella sp. 417]